jgi:hypothetical protein
MCACQFAGLLLLARLPECAGDEGVHKRVLDAIGPKFLGRMLASPFDADGQLDTERRPYIEVAVTVSATLCDVPAFFESAHLLRHTPTFIRLALGSEASVRDDALRVATAIAKHEHARDGLLTGNVFDELTRVASETGETGPAFSILECLVSAIEMPASHAVTMLGGLVRAMQVSCLPASAGHC